MIFVFGSNLRGVHGAGAALFAKQHHGATYGIGAGMSGNSYALPTKDMQIQTLPIQNIAQHVERFLRYARFHRDLEFQVTRIGCGLAGYTDAQIAPMFTNAPYNCLFDQVWAEYLPHHRIWS